MEKNKTGRSIEVDSRLELYFLHTEDSESEKKVGEKIKFKLKLAPEKGAKT